VHFWPIFSLPEHQRASPGSKGKKDKKTSTKTPIEIYIYIYIYRGMGRYIGLVVVLWFSGYFWNSFEKVVYSKALSTSVERALETGVCSSSTKA
jgi:hypothetical protein